jgi:hypothetical protein
MGATHSWVFFPLAIAVLLSFPQAIFLKSAEPDEKALSIGQVRVYDAKFT